jgi:hypothetical protein
MNEEPVFVRTSERKSYKTCRQQWWWSFVDRLEAVRTKPALRFGDLVHRALAPWYCPGRKRGPHPAKTFVTLYDEQIEEGQRKFNIRIEDDEDWADARDLGVAMLENYVSHYGKEDLIRVVSAEFPFQHDVFDKYGRYLCTYVGIFDLVFEDLGTSQIGLMETKTAAQISTLHLPIDEQAGSYWAFAPEVLQERGIIEAGRDIDFILYNFLRKAKPDERPRNEEGLCLNRDGTVSKRQPSPYFYRQRVYRDEHDREELMRRVRAEAWEMQKVKAGKLPVYKNPGGTWPNQQCNGCEFLDMCQLHETGSDWEELRRLTMKTWDPYEEHRDDREMEMA